MDLIWLAHTILDRSSRWMQKRHQWQNKWQEGRWTLEVVIKCFKFEKWFLEQNCLLLPFWIHWTEPHLMKLMSNFGWFVCPWMEVYRHCKEKLSWLEEYTCFLSASPAFSMTSMFCSSFIYFFLADLSVIGQWFLASLVSFPFLHRLPVFLNSLQSNQPQALKCAPRGSNNCK